MHPCFRALWLATLTLCACRRSDERPGDAAGPPGGSTGGAAGSASSSTSGGAGGSGGEPDVCTARAQTYQAMLDDARLETGAPGAVLAIHTEDCGLWEGAS